MKKILGTILVMFLLLAVYMIIYSSVQSERVSRSTTGGDCFSIDMSGTQITDAFYCYGQFSFSLESGEIYSCFNVLEGVMWAFLDKKYPDIDSFLQGDEYECKIRNL